MHGQTKSDNKNQCCCNTIPKIKHIYYLVIYALTAGGCFGPILAP